ncbi:uncharacterized protein LOC124491782 [Dermatophagoides farinae]|uniref:uncharacterized protein LOC124491782 n=1 Tax=Dermatophagoides farinae TaxID=6954 RepID=UPI001F0E430C|nr:uncharacterized protein LOC124491782 [Dermatophagoides farinae]
MNKLIPYVFILTNLSIFACWAQNENITNEPMSSRMVPNYNMMSTFSAPPPIPKFSFPNPYGMRYMPGKPIDPILLAPHVMNGIVPMALSFSVGYFLLRLLTLGLFFAEKAFPYGHYRIDDKNSMAMDNMANIWRRTDLTTSSSYPSKTGPLLLHLYNKAMDKYNYPYDEQQQQQQQQQQIGKQHE